MVLPRKEGFMEGDRDKASDRTDRPIGVDEPEESREMDGSGSSVSCDYVGRSRRVTGLAERMRDVLRDEDNGDLLLEQSDLENGVLQWLRALDLQVIGACRADERLKPLLKLNVSSGAAEDRLVAQMSQYFEASEVGMLARCLCIPLVSIRVGKINKQGNLLCPTCTSMHVSFTGDDGCTEKLAVVRNDSERSAVIIEEISADNSGRSFLLKLPGSRVSYYWCSEKSKLRGMELLVKMKDLLSKKPTLSHLTGISESRLDSFATHLRRYLGSPNTQEATSTASSLMAASNQHATEPDLHSSSKSSRLRIAAAHTAKVHPFYQGSLGARSNTFKDGMLRGSLYNRSGAREKLRRRGDSYSSLLAIDNLPVTSVPTSCTTSALFTSQCEDENSSSSELRSTESCCSMLCCLSEIPCLSSPLSSFSPSSTNLHRSQVTSPGHMFSPYYCWCPLSPSPLQYTVTPSHLAVVSTESLPLPPLSSLLSSPGPPVSIISSKLPIDTAEIPSLNLPSLFPETLVRLPIPVSSLVTLPSSHPTFTPFMSDPIVHIPIIDVCSAGQGYLVSAGPGISSAIAPLLPNRASPLIPETESVMEKSARETLRMLMASAPTSTSPQLMNMLPEIFNRTDENFPTAHASNHAAVVAGSRCLYTGTLDVKALASGVSFMGLSLSRGKIAHCDSSNMRVNLERDHHGDSEEMELSERTRVSEGSSYGKEDGA